MIRVIAKERGYFGCLREVGDIFEVPDDTEFKDAWFEREQPEAKGKAKAKPPADEPEAVDPPADVI